MPTKETGAKDCDRWDTVVDTITVIHRPGNAKQKAQDNLKPTSKNDKRK